MPWERATAASDLPEGERVVVRIAGHSILLVHTHGEIFAVQSSCPHMIFPMKGGKITEDCAIVCPLHRSTFDLRTGEPKSWTPWPPLLGPAAGKVIRERPMQTWPCKVEDGHVWVEV